MARCRLKISNIIYLLVFAPFILKAQEDRDQKLQQILESVVENMEAEADLTDLHYWLSFYYENPLNLNKATETELQNLFILTQTQINDIINHRQKFGNFISIYELQSIDGLDIETINSLIPFVQIGFAGEAKTYTIKQMLKGGRHELNLRYSTTLEEESGYATSNLRNRFLGDDYGLQLRYNYRFGTQLSYGFVAEKDAGEEFFKGTQKQGFDFYSGHIYYTGEKWLKTLTVGDYHVQFGQGLVMWTSFGIGKSAEVLRIARQPRGILPSRGVNEFGFLRGAAATFKFRNFNATVFGSHTNRDANFRSELDSTGNTEAFFSSLIYGGYHRNLAEIENKNTITESIGGAAVSYQKNRLRLSLHGMYGGYNTNFSRSISIYDQFENTSNTFGAAGISYSYLVKNIYLFGEAALDKNSNTAYLQGILISLHSRFDVGILHRNYSRGFSNQYAAAFAEGSRPVNEQGTYFGASFKASNAWRLNFYADVFKFPWLRYRTDAPTNGHEFLADANYKPSKKLEAIFRYRYKNKSLNASVKHDKLNIPVENTLQNIRLQLNYQATEQLRLRTRAEFTFFNEVGIGAQQTGFAAFQDADYHFRKIPLQISARYVFFDVETYNARIYTFENDVRYSFSVPFMQDEGVRWYVLADYMIYRGLSLQARIAQTRLYNKNTIGSGLNLIEEPKRTELKVQLRYLF